MNQASVGPGKINDHANPAFSLVSLTAMHFLVDLHSGMFPVILLYQRNGLGLTLTQVGILAGTYNFALSLAQPFFGYLADRWGTRRLVLPGILWIALLGAGFGFMPTFGWLLLLAPLAAFGSSAFHPAAASTAARLMSSRRGSGTSFFLVGGSIGYAVGPLVASFVFERLGLHGTLAISLGALVSASLIWLLANPFRQITLGQPEPKHVSRPSTLPVLPVSLGLAVFCLIILSGSRTWIYSGLSNFIPQQMHALGLTEVHATWWLAIMLMFNSLGVLLGGLLTDRIGPRLVFNTSLAGLIPVLYLAAHASAVSLGLLASLAGFLIGIPVAAVLVVGQSFLPRGTSLATGLVLGISFTIGAVGVAVTGWISDAHGLPTGIMVFAGLALLGAVSGLAMPQNMPIEKTIPVETIEGLVD